MYVDNNGLRTNAKELVQWFDDSLKKQGEIEMVPEGKFGTVGTVGRVVQKGVLSFPILP